MSSVSGHFHIVYNIKGRLPSIPKKLQPKLRAYIGVHALGKRHGFEDCAVPPRGTAGLLSSCHR